MGQVKNNYWWSFREEILATAIVLIVAISGSFFVVSRLFSANEPADSQAVITEANLTATPGKILGSEALSQPSPTLSTSKPIDITGTPTGNPYDSEVFYGSGGLYDFEEYTLGLSSPRISFDALNPVSRRFVVDVTLTNKNVTQGLQPILTATIIKDGAVIVPQTPLSIKEFGLVLPGEKKTYEARLSLIEGTDVSGLKFMPPNLTPVEHMLQP